MTVPDQRRAERLPATDTRGNIAFRPFRLIDLSDIGARIETTVWLAPGRDYLLKLDDPSFQIAGRVAWAKLMRFEAGGSTALFEAGIEFGDASPAARTQLTLLMVRFATRSEGEPLPVLDVLQAG